MNGKMLRDAMLSGANQITNEREAVNALNVFPVPDGDTGTNMSMTICAAKGELERLDDNATVEAVSKTAAGALLRGARGNSGVILSLLFRGFSKGLTGLRTAGPADIAKAFAMGVESAYKAVMKPTEGTILTVSRAAAEQAKISAEKEGVTLVSLWDDMIAAASEALEKTPELLPVLKKAGVVDAGGKGFVHVLEGMASVIRGEEIVALAGEDAPARRETPTAAVFQDEHGFSGEITFTYCTEFIVKREDNAKDPAGLRAFLESIGDCVVVVDDEEIIKVHVHTNDPGKAIQNALKYGQLTKVKIENMREQFEDRVATNAEKKAREEAEADAAFPYAAVDPNRRYGFVSVAAGEGIKQLFLDLGVDQVVSGGQTMNPSTDDILRAVHATPAQTVYVLPNNKNIIMAAEQAIRLADRKVMVLQTRTIPQGLTAMLAYDESLDPDALFMAMGEAAEHVQTGQITFAARDSDFDGHKIHEGEMLALDNGKLSFVEKDLTKAAVRLTRSLVKKGDCSFVTVLHGEDVSEADAEKIADAIRAKLGESVEVALVNGGQPVYYLIISAE